MRYPGDPNIWLLTPLGNPRPIYRVDCPVNQDGGYCTGSKLVVFVPACEDPDEEAKKRATPWLLVTCAVPGCGAPIDWNDLEDLVDDGVAEVGEDEIMYMTFCRPKQSIWRRLFGREKPSHTYTSNIVSIEDDSDDDSEIPERLPFGLTDLPDPVTA